MQRAHLPHNLPNFSGPFSFTLQTGEPPGLWEEPRQELPENQTQLWFDESKGKPLAVVGSFLLVEHTNALWLVDLRETYEQAAHEVGNPQILMIPIQIFLSTEEAMRMQEVVQRCSEAGLEAKALGSKLLCIDAIPHWLSRTDVTVFVDLIKEDLWRNIALTETIRRFCRSVPKRFTLSDAHILWQQKQIGEIRLEAADLERILLKKQAHDESAH